MRRRMEIEKHCNQKIAAFWESFLRETHRPETTKYLEVFHFELTRDLANELLRLVLIGQKKATASSLWSYDLEGERVPIVGDLSIVTDWEGIRSEERRVGKEGRYREWWRW